MARSPPEIVMLPGLDGTGDLFDRLVRAIGSDLITRVVRYPNDPTLGYAGYVEIVRKEIAGRRMFLLGESFSGPVAMMLAAQLPAQIMGLVLAATFLENPWPGWLIRRAARVDPLTTPVRIRDALLMGPYGDTELSAKVDDIVKNLPRAVRAARLRAVAGVDVRADFARVRCPILVLHGRSDRIVRKSPMQRAVADKGGARMIVLPAAHMLLQTRANEAASEIVHFTHSAMEIPYEA